MRFSSSLFALAAAIGMAAANPIESRQEAARFGLVSVTPVNPKITDVGISRFTAHLP